MAATKIKVTFKSVYVRDDEDWFGPGEWFFDATVRCEPSGKTFTVGDTTRHEVNDGDTLTLDWSQEVDIDPADEKIVIRLQGTDEDSLFDDDLGWIRLTLLTPIVNDYEMTLTSSKACFDGLLEVDILERTKDATGTITTIRETMDSSTFSTLHVGMLSKLVHINPVVPVPWSEGIPKKHKGVLSLSSWKARNTKLSASTSDYPKLNKLVNPAVIPVLDPAHADFANRCARIMITEHRPDNLQTKIIWKAVTDNVKLWDGSTKTEIKGGREVMAYGVLSGDSDQKCTIEVCSEDEGQPLLATYCAWVGKPKYVWCRANIIKCSRASTPANPIVNPTITEAQIKQHINFANIVLWQAAITLVMDTEATTAADTVESTTEEGIFTVTKSTNYTYKAERGSDKLIAPLLNAREGVFNMAYIHSVKGSSGLLGSASDRRMSEASDGTETLATSPSNSWVRPTGVWPDSPACTVTMKTMGKSDARKDEFKTHTADGKIDKICACIMTDNVQLRVARGNITLPHELGHVLGLHHRGNGGNEDFGSYDGVNHQSAPFKGKGHPFKENMMCYGNDARRQDIDMVQANVLRGHPLVKDTAPTKPAPPPPPPPKKKEKKKVPPAWTPTKADVILMQEYLTGKRPGLKHTGYHLGSYGPDGDGVDGIYGDLTTKAVRSFQKDHGGIGIDGKYGPETEGAFDEELNGDI